MTESGYTTITVTEQTKERLDEHRDGRPWDQYLETLRREHADPLTLNDAEELADHLVDKIAEGGVYDPADNADVDTEALAEELQERIDYPEQQDTERIVQRLEDLETRLPSKVARELQQ